MAANRIQEAMAHFSRALAIDPGFVSARNSLGICLMWSSQSEAAVGQFEKAIAADPHQPALFLNLAISHSLLSNYQAAEHAARQALELDRAGNQIIRFMLAWALYHQRKFTTEAVNCLETAGSAVPVAHLLLARIMFGQGERDRARLEIAAYRSSEEKTFEDAAQTLSDILDGKTRLAEER
jgi:Flp pilus assembly protein TadD